MTSLKKLRLKKNEDRRLRAGHVWIFSNEVDTPLKNFSPGEEVLIEAYDKTILGVAYVNPHSLISARLFTRHQNERLNYDFLIKSITAALNLRTRLYSKPYYRLIFGESDGLPGLIVDRFNDTLSVQINTAGMDAKTNEIMKALQHVIPEIRSILLRNDNSVRLQEGLEKNIIAGFGEPPEKIFIEENNASFYAPLWLGQKTGWFYDHRLNRTRLQSYVSNKRVLDVFSYLGGWGIQAAKWNASEVVCIDSSSLSSAWIKENAELNHVSEKVNTIQEDAFEALKKLAVNNQLFDVIILDPPAFIKKQKDKKEGFTAYQRINEAALKLLSPDGILISCSCSMHMEYNDLVQAIRKAALRNQFNLQIIERGHQGPDHPIHLAIPETDYLKMIIVRRF
jgi:23S rRNA (cytosine1962-C5)-methyltransferase